jgi:hypothetical protein
MLTLKITYIYINLQAVLMLAPSPSFFKIGFLSTPWQCIFVQSIAWLIYELKWLLSITFVLFREVFVFSSLHHSKTSTIYVPIYIYVNTVLSKCNLRFHQKWLGCSYSWSRTCLSHPQMSQIVHLKIILFNIFLLKAFFIKVTWMKVGDTA